MDIQLLWCEHCGVRYEYQFSGDGCLNQEASRTHCKECNTAIKTALAPITKKVVERFIPCPEFNSKFQKETEEKFNWDKQCRTIHTYINGDWYNSFKIGHPDELNRPITVYCCDGKEVLVRAKFDIATNKLLRII